MILISLLACTETCPDPKTRLDADWDVFVNAVEHTIENEPAFPADTSPGNGPHAWRVDWNTDQLFKGAVQVTMDGQTFDGTGTWSEVECGHFSLAWSGIYEAETGAEHAFAAGAVLVTYEHELEGFMDWEETWKAPDGQVGTYVAATQVFGTSL
jgi:hypothetical protein